MKKILIVLLTLLLCFSAGLYAQAASEVDKGYDIYVYNSKGENAAQFAAMCAAYEAETGIRVKNFSIGSGQDHMETLRSEMNSRNKPSIFSIQGIKELAEWSQGGFVLDLNSVTTGDFAQMAQTIPVGLRLTTDGKTSYGIPYNVEGYGYIVDCAMLAELFGPSRVDAVLADLKAASYSEWEALIKALDSWIQSPKALRIKLNNKEYTLASTSGTLSSQLNGVFAVMGAEKWTYGDHFINVAMNAVFANSIDSHDATVDTIRSLKGALVAYAKALDLKTSYLAGLKGPGSRGQDFVSSANFGYDQAVQIFADSKGIFFKQGNWAYGNIEAVNPAQAARLEFIPVKMPYTPSDITRRDGITIDQLNSSIPVFVPNYYAINATVSKDEQQKAFDFLTWMNNSATGKHFLIDEFAFIPYNADPKTTTVPNSLGNSIIAYIAQNATLTAPYHGAPASWSGDVVGLKIMESYLTKKVWTQADYNAIADYAIQEWIALQ